MKPLISKLLKALLCVLLLLTNIASIKAEDYSEEKEVENTTKTNKTETSDDALLEEESLTFEETENKDSDVLEQESSIQEEFDNQSELENLQEKDGTSPENTEEHPQEPETENLALEQDINQEEVPEESTEEITSSNTAYRLLVSSDTEVDKQEVIASHDNVYLLEFENKEQADEAKAELESSSNYIDYDIAFSIDEGEDASEEFVEREHTEENNPLTFLENEEVISSPSKVIALIDTGVNSDDVVGRISVFNDEGYDDNGHGQRMYDTIKSIAPDAQILSIKALDSNGQGTVSEIYAAIMYAIEANADIINMSFSAYETDEISSVKEAINVALEKGITVITSAGNYNSNIQNYTPANISGVLTAGSIMNNGYKSASSNYGDVDYWVKSQSTSYASAKLSGHLYNNDDLSNNDDILSAEDFNKLDNCEKCNITDEETNIQKDESGNLFYVQAQTLTIDDIGSSVTKSDWAAGNPGYNENLTVKLTAYNSSTGIADFEVINTAWRDDYTTTTGWCADKIVKKGNETLTSKEYSRDRASWLEEHMFFSVALVKGGTVTISVNDNNFWGGCATYSNVEFNIYAPNDATIFTPTTSKLTVNPNGGTWSGSTSNQSFTQNIDTTKTIANPTRTGYTFNGWTKSGGGTYNSSTRVFTFGSTDGTLKANWTAVKSKVIFHKNTSASDTSTYTESYTYGASGNKFGMNLSSTGGQFGAWDRSGYKLLGWNDSQSASTKQYDVYSNVSDSWIAGHSPEHHLYAVWVPYEITVIYNANGGSVSADGYRLSNNIVQTNSSGSWANAKTIVKSDVQYQNLFNYTTFGLTRTGYTYIGTEAWNSNAAGTGTKFNQDYSETNTANPVNAKTLNGGSIPTSDKTITIYAKWNPNKYQIAFNANRPSGTSGSGTMNNQTNLLYDQSYNLTANTFTTSGHKFTGWNTKADGSGTSYADKASFKNLTTTNNGTVTLYAQWSTNQYTLTVKPNGGTWSSKTTDQTFTQNYKTTKSIALPTRTGYQFNNWSKSSTFYGTFSPTTSAAATYTFGAGNDTITAQWTPNTYTVKYNGNKPSSASTSVSGTMSDDTGKKYDTEYTLKNNAFTLTGYKWLRWDSKADDSGTNYANQAKYKNLTTANNGTVTMYAQWEPITYKIHYDVNAPSTTINGSTSVVSTSGTMTDKTNLKYDTNYNLDDNKFSAYGYTWLSWNTKADGSGQSFSNKAQIKNLTTKDGETITLYAQWSPVLKSVYVKCVDKEDNSVLKEYTLINKQALGTNYSSNPEEIEYWDYVGLASNSASQNGQVSNEDQTITYLYEKVRGSVIVEHRDIETNKLLDKEVLIDNKHIIDHQKYSSQQKRFTSYFFSKMSDDSAPRSGEIKRGEQIVTYLYQHVTGDLIVLHKDKETGDLLKSEYLMQRVEEDTPYSVEPQEFANYTYDSLASNSAPANGKVKIPDSTVIFLYNRDRGSIYLEYLDKETGKPLKEKQNLITDVRVGTRYQSEPAEIENYNYIGLASNSAPQNGAVTKGENSVIFLYEHKKGNLLIEYRDIETNEILNAISKENIYTGEGYTSEEIKIDNYTFVKFADSSDAPKGIIKEGETKVIYLYERDKGSVIVKYLDSETKQEIALADTIKDKVPTGETYSVSPKEFKGYRLLIVDGQENGTVQKGETIISYTYEKIRGSVFAEYRDENSELIHDIVTIKDNVPIGEEYSSSPLEIDDYDYVGLANDSAQEQGLVTEEPQTIKYQYRLKRGNVKVYYKNIEDGSIIEETLLLDNAKIHSPYEASQKVFDGYEFIKTEEGSDETKGTLEKPEVNIIFLYKPYFAVNYEWDSEYPEEIVTLLPERKTPVYNGEKISAPNFEQQIIDGFTYAFNGWDENSKVVNGEDLLFTGSWRKTKLMPIEIEPVIDYLTKEFVLLDCDNNNLVTGKITLKLENGEFVEMTSSINKDDYPNHDLSFLDADYSDKDLEKVPNEIKPLKCEPKIVKGSACLIYKDTNGNILKEKNCFVENVDEGTPYKAPEYDLKDYILKEIIGNTEGSIKEGETLIEYVCEAIPEPEPLKGSVLVECKDEQGNIIKSLYILKNQALDTPYNLEPFEIPQYDYVGLDNGSAALIGEVKEGESKIILLYKEITYKVTFVDGEEVLKIQDGIKPHGFATSPTPPSKEGYEFVGWDKKYDDITGDLVVKALWKEIVHKVTFTDGFGKVLKVQENVKHHSSATAPSSPELNGYKFKAWDKKYDDITEDIVVNATWDKIPQRKIVNTSSGKEIMNICLIAIVSLSVYLAIKTKEEEKNNQK